MFQLSGEEIEFVSVHVTNNVVSIKVTLWKETHPYEDTSFYTQIIFLLTSISLLLIEKLNIEFSLKSLLLQILWSMVTDQGRKRFYKLISATILMENMLKAPKEKGGTLPSDGTECL